jgi:hypothetical protein
MYTLHKVAQNGNRFCGPAAISAITGIGTKEAAALIRTISGKRQVKGTTYNEVLSALRVLNWRTHTLYEAARGKGITLAAWLKQSKAMRTAGRLFLVVAGWHWQVISGRRYTCGRCKGEIVSVRDKLVKRRARVARVYEVVR